MIYMSKMVPSADQGGRFITFGRVFSGTVRSGQVVRIQGPKYEPGKRDDMFEKPVQRVLVMMGKHAESLGSCPAGCIVGLAGIDQFLLKSGTVTSSDKAYNLKSMKFSVSPVVQIAVAPKVASDLPKLIDGLKRLSKADPLCLVTMSESGEHILAAAGELHLEICLQDLEEEHAQIPLKVLAPSSGQVPQQAQPPGWDDLGRTAVDTVPVQQHIHDVEPAAPHWLLAQHALLGRPLEGRHAGVPHVGEVLGRLGLVNKQVWPVRVWPKAPHLSRGRHIPPVLVDEFPGPPLWFLEGGDLAGLDGVNQGGGEWQGGHVEAVELVGGLGQADHGGGLLYGLAV